jgi:hypothetical protein
MVVVTMEVKIYNNTEDETEITRKDIYVSSRTSTCHQCYSFHARIAFAFNVLI